MRSRRISELRTAISLGFLLGLVIPGIEALSAAQPEKPTAYKEMEQEWTNQIVGRKYYLREPRFPLLANDQIAVTYCRISYSPTWDKNGESTGIVYSATLRMKGSGGAPPERIGMRFKQFKDLAELNDLLIDSFSPTPLEEAFDWPQEIKNFVRTRYVVLGMNADMVRLVLGGVPYQTDLERLDDGRIRETWKLQLKGDTRRVFTARNTSLKVSSTTETEGSTSARAQAIGDLVVSSASGRATSVSNLQSEATSSGFYLFSGLPPQFLHIVCTDGKVTARKTEFLK